MPIMLKRITIFSWGIDIKLIKNYLTIVWKGDKHIHFSPDGTPGKAIWKFGKYQPKTRITARAVEQIAV